MCPFSSAQRHFAIVIRPRFSTRPNQYWHCKNLDWNKSIVNSGNLSNLIFHCLNQTHYTTKVGNVSTSHNRNDSLSIYKLQKYTRVSDCPWISTIYKMTVHLCVITHLDVRGSARFIVARDDRTVRREGQAELVGRRIDIWYGQQS